MQAWQPGGCLSTCMTDLQLSYQPSNNTVTILIFMPRAISMRALAFDFDALAGVCRRQAVCLLVAFGSTVRNLRGPDSDLDLAVWLPTTNSAPQALVRLEVALRPLFPGERLDLVFLNGATPDSDLANAALEKTGEISGPDAQRSGAALWLDHKLIAGVGLGVDGATARGRAEGRIRGGRGRYQAKLPEQPDARDGPRFRQRYVPFRRARAAGAR